MLDEAMRAACASLGIVPPARINPGKWVRTNTLERNGKGDASVLVFDDRQGGIVWNWQTQQKQTFTTREPGQAPAPRKRDIQAERRAEEDRLAVESLCREIVRTCDQKQHPYLAAKGFADEMGLVHENPRRCVPDTRLGRLIAEAMPAGEGPFLIVPGRIGSRVATVQFIAPDGSKKNIYRGAMREAFHRISTGRATWVCEGIATALSVRAALRLLGVSATVLSAFSASNVALVASAIPGARIAADNDKPVPTLGDLGTGEFYARQSGCVWTMPPERGDFNDLHQSAGLRAVALHLKGVIA